MEWPCVSSKIRWRLWLGATLRLLGPPLPQELLQGKWLAMAGDSIARSLFAALLRLAEDAAPPSRQVPSVPVHPSTTTTARAACQWLPHQPMCSAPSTKEPGRYCSCLVLELLIYSSYDTESRCGSAGACGAAHS